MASRPGLALRALLLGAFVQIVLANPAPQAAVTEGPQAYVSYAAMPAFSTLKPCAQGCLKYNGVYHCSLQGYWDLGKEIKCGCSPQNYCLCDPREGAAVSSYINKCVATQCTLPGEVSAVLDLYNGYCATANIAVATTSSKPYSFTGVTAATSKTPAPAVESEVTSRTSAAARETASGVNQVSSPNQSSAAKPALGLGAIIGIAVGGVVLIAALLCAGCCLIWRRRRNKKRANNTAAVANQGFTAGTAATTPDVNYIAPVGGAAQLDGKPGTVKIEEKPPGSLGGSTTVSPLQTPQPTPQPAQAMVYNGNPNPHAGVGGITGVNNAHEVQGNNAVPANTHEMYGNQQAYPRAHEVQGNTGYQPNAHEMYGGHQSPTNAHEVQGNGAYVTNSHEMHGNGQHAPHAHEMLGVRQENGQFSPTMHEMGANRGHGSGQVAEIYTHSPRPQGANL